MPGDGAVRAPRPSSSFASGSTATSLEGSLAAGVLLATVLFAAILAINRVFVAEREQGGFDAIRLAPVDGTALYAAKVVRAGRLPGRARADRGAGVRDPLPRRRRRPAARWRRCSLLADLGLAAIGALVSSIAVNSRARDLIAPLLLLPLLVPVMIAAAGAAEPLLAAGGPSYDDFGKWMAVLALYDVVFCLVGYAVYDFLLED